MGKNARSAGPAPLGFLVGLMVLAVAGTLPAGAWTPASQLSIAESGAQLAPPDVVRQIARHREKFQEGVLAPFRSGTAERHGKNPDGTGTLDEVLLYEVHGAIQAIRAHRPFEEVVFRLGVVAHYVADANNPLNTSSNDPGEGRYFADYLRYMESAERRFQPVFYGLRPEVQEATTLAPLVEQALRRGRGLYPIIGREYQRVGSIDGRRLFDDRSSAYAVASLSYSHAVTDVAEALRFIWLKAGGGDARTALPKRGEQVMLVPRPGGTATTPAR
jgi:hypothetical protein